MASGPTITVNGYTIVGKTQPASAKRPKAVNVFFGVPYASAGRFEAPVPLAPGSGPLTGSLDASKPAPGCPSPMAQNSAETPLRLNVFRPAGKREEEKLPVVVFFHGGAFNFGSPLDSSMGSFVSHAARGVVAVTVAYRLGVFGFLDGEGGGQLNLGLKDQRAAVGWLQEWVGVFDGDGGDITLMGVSAGAHSIGHHLLNPQRLPVRKAILESGSPTARSVFSATHPRTSANAASFKAQLHRTTAAQAKADDLVQAGVMVWAEHMAALTWPFQPVVDGAGGVVPDIPLKLWEGFDGSVPILTGFCSHEGADFIPKRPPPFRAFFSTLIPGLVTEDLEALEALYPEQGVTPAAQVKRLGEAYGHYAYICPILHTAHAASLKGARVYLYEFAAITSAGTWSAAHASHSTALTRDTPPALPGLAATGQEMHTRWTEFITSPNGEVSSWPEFKTPFDGQGSGELLVFGDGNTEGVGGGEKGTAVKTRRVTEREKDVCRFWWERMELSQGLGERGVVKRTW